MDACRIFTRRIVSKSRWSRLEELQVPADLLNYLNYFRPLGKEYEATRFERKNPPHESSDEQANFPPTINGIVAMPGGLQALAGMFPPMLYGDSDEESGGDENDDEEELDEMLEDEQMHTDEENSGEDVEEEEEAVAVPVH